MHTHRKGVTAAPKVISMLNYGQKLLSAFLEQPNETLRDIAGDVHAIVAVLDAVEQIHRTFLELLIDLSNDPCYHYETESTPDWEIDDDPW